MNALRQLILLLALSFLCFYGVAVSSLELKWGRFELVKADVAPPQAENYAALASPAVASRDHTQAPVDRRPKKILLIGDSMAEGMMSRILDYAEASGHRVKTVSWYGSGTRQYGKSDTLAYFLRNYKADFVILCLGTNEMEIPHIGRQHRQYLSRILAQLGSTPYVWVGPPLIGHDTGINDLIAQMVGPGRFFSSKSMSMPRQGDGIHPTRLGFGIWVDSLARWVQSQSQDPLYLRSPVKAKLHLKPDVLVLPQS